MRPQYNRRAQRATAALGAVLLAAGGFGTVASASTSRAHPVRVRSRRAQPKPQPQPKRARGRHSRRHRRAVRLRATMLRGNVLIGQDLVFVGTVNPGSARRLIGVERRQGSRWIEVARTLTDSKGRFLARFWPRQLGAVRLRVRVGRSPKPAATVVGAVATVYRAVFASWYGPGGRTACGEQLGAGTLGVANRTLACGTLVTLHYGNRTVSVPVIDRGPFVAGRDYDLTYATKLALGAGDVSLIWASA